MDQRITAHLGEIDLAQWTRRMTLVSIGALISSRAFPSAAFAQATTPSAEAEVDFVWEMPQRYGRRAAEHLGWRPETVRRSPNDEGSRGGPLLVVIAGVIALVWLAQAIIRLRREIRYGGIIVQDNGRRLSIRNDPRLPGNLIVIRDRNGVTIRELGGNVTTDELIRFLPRNGGNARGR